ncbi:MAG: hypothetical protein IJX39_04845 [Clostridia bacterium]|nr:hypothetical protein [Clostridia bacterium]
MAKRPILSKTVVDRHCKYHPKGERDKKMHEAIYGPRVKPKAADLPPYYEIMDFWYDPETHMVQINFLETVITDENKPTEFVDGLPVWSGRKTILVKKLRLDNFQLEFLNQHDNAIIREFAIDIVYLMGDLDRLPSWFVAEIAKRDYEMFTKKEKEKIAYNEYKYKNQNQERAMLLQENAEMIGDHINKIRSLEQEIKTYKSTIASLRTNPRSIISSLLFVKSKAQRMIAEIELKRVKVQEMLESEIRALDEVKMFDQELRVSPPKISLHEYTETVNDCQEKIKKIENRYKNIIEKIEQLPFEDTELFYEEYTMAYSSIR